MPKKGTGWRVSSTKSVFPRKGGTGSKENSHKSDIIERISKERITIRESHPVALQLLFEYLLDILIKLQLAIRKLQRFHVVSNRGEHHFFVLFVMLWRITKC